MSDIRKKDENYSKKGEIQLSPLVEGNFTNSQPNGKTNSREMEKGQKALEKGRGWDPLFNYVFIANINFAFLA